ncbi:hypothetical protein MKK75_03800 [Methylobacterium sp. J-030]|uniref:hypothetical protein n=1 Tax=Methylobacterium sp. J-030 TaxID=2836627 RepID=UPI001FB87D9E|nr:hypothetical protein [Methylobacterium sp. J-030]MCJ2067939.1 hypothetical protein [Methylobacterium sp. J-030]
MGADVIRLPGPAGPRTPPEIEAAMRTHVEALKALALELAAAQGYDPATVRQRADQPDEVLSLQRAAHAIGCPASFAKPSRT